MSAVGTIPKVKVGDKVRLVHMEQFFKDRAGWEGKTATVTKVVNFPTTEIYVKWHHTEESCTPAPWRWELVETDLDPKLTIRHRDGKSATWGLTGDTDRPYTAIVNNRCLTFAPSGKFYPGIEQDIDLVNE